MSAEHRSDIAERAYELWDAAGRPDGEADHFWHKAERELDASEISIETSGFQSGQSKHLG
jgi:plasmid replication initiation protein